MWVYGDQVNDHGLYDVFLNGTQAGTFNGRSGCGGGYAKYCEKLHGLAFFAGQLPPGQHEVRIVNGGPDTGNKTFFGKLQHVSGADNRSRLHRVHDAERVRRRRKQLDWKRGRRRLGRQRIALSPCAVWLLRRWFWSRR